MAARIVLWLGQQLSFCQSDFTPESASMAMRTGAARKANGEIVAELPNDKPPRADRVDFAVSRIGSEAMPLDASMQ
eukprot:scaffold6180_cov200-Pinguiococcus_pyrenoidosus.AAC.8